MTSKSQKKSKDEALYESLIKAFQTHTVVLTVDAERFNHPGSPVWNGGENVGPLLALVLISAILSFIVNAIAGMAMLMLSTVMFLYFIRPWILRRVHQRTRAAAVGNLHDWDLLWKKGGLGLVEGRTKAGCVSPGGDWRAFARRYAPPPEAEGMELYSAFTRAKKSETELKTIPDLNM